MENQSVTIENGGQGGIRTLGTLSRTHAFQACALNHSATCPSFFLRAIACRRSGTGGVYTEVRAGINRYFAVFVTLLQYSS